MDLFLQLIDALSAERCLGCGYQLRWVIKRMTDADIGAFYATGLCKRCSHPRE